MNAYEWAAVDVFRLHVVEAEVLGREHLFEVRRHELEAGGQRDLVVAVVARDHTPVVPDLLVGPDIEALLRLGGRAVQGVLLLIR